MANVLSTLDLIRIRMWCVADNQASVNTVYYLCTGPNTGGVTDVEVATALQLDLHPLYVALIANTAEWRGVQVQIVNSPPRNPAVGNAAPHIGTAGPIGAPRQVAGLIQWQTNFSGRAYRGRNYIPFPATADITADGAPTAGYGTKLLALSNYWLNLYFLVDTTGTRFIPCEQVIPHFLKKGQVGPALPPTPVTAWSVSNRWATQRKRGSFGQANLSPI